MRKFLHQSLLNLIFTHLALSGLVVILGLALLANAQPTEAGIAALCGAPFLIVSCALWLFFDADQRTPYRSMTRRLVAVGGLVFVIAAAGTVGLAAQNHFGTELPTSALAALGIFGGIEFSTFLSLILYMINPYPNPAAPAAAAATSRAAGLLKAAQGGKPATAAASTEDDDVGAP